MSVDSRGALELVRAGLISYRQLNEVHKLVKETGGGDLRNALLERGYVTEEQLQRRNRARPTARKRLKLTYSLDLVKAGLLSFKQLNECHREARESQGKSTVLDVAVEKGFVSDLQVATLPEQSGFAAQDKHNKRFSSSWDLFRGGLVNLRALNECHRQIKLDSPNKSLKEALIERGYVSADQVANFQASAHAAKAEDEGSAFMEKYAGELAQIPTDLKERLRREHLESRGLAPEGSGPSAEAPAAKPKRPAQPRPSAEVQAAPPIRSAIGAPPPQPAADYQEDEEEEEEEDGDFRAARTFMDLGDEEEEEDEEEAEEDGDFRAARTFMDMGDEEEEEDEEEAEADGDFRAARTFMDMGDAEEEEEEEEDGDFRAARTFMDMGDAEEEEEEEDGDFRAARTFMDMGEAEEEEEEEDGDFRAARTFLEIGSAVEEDAEDLAPRTFMDLESDPGFTSAQTDRGTFMDEADAGNTFLDIGMPGLGEETTSSSLGNQSEFRRKEDGTFMDVGAQVGSSTEVGSKTDASSKTDAGTSSSGGSNTEAGSRTDAGSRSTQSKKKKKKKKKAKDEDDAYSHPLVGKVIGGCRIVKKIGEGGMGAVFLAEHTRLKRQSVIKVIPAHLTNSRQLIARFQREAQAAAVIQHPNVVNVFNVGEENGVHFIEMEFVDGAGLDDRMKEVKVIDQMEGVRIIIEACRGLSQAHKNGIVHRDIKPDNIMLTRKGGVKIADFGLARAASADAELTKVGQILGTPAYMSPEQCQGKQTDARCDLYSLGATFYAMITGKRPFTGKTVMEIMQKHIDEVPISPREYNPDISVQVAKVILKMMSKKPEDRHQDALEVIDDLERFIKEEGTEHLEKIQKAIGDRFKLQKKLGQGGMGAVYSARCGAPGEGFKEGDIVAVKVLTSDVTQEDVERFRLEAELAQSVDHPGIIKVLEFKISKDVNYIVMEFVEGDSVRDLLHDKKLLEEKEVIRILKAACMALGAAHEKQIIHRDIKPDNLMIASDGRVKIADFGVAKKNDGQSELTQAGFLVGTPHYMSPEQCSGEAGVEVTVRADVYSLGATGYFMATGEKPFEGDTQPTILLQHMKTPPREPNEVKEGLSEGLSNVIRNMMAKRPEKRYATLKEVLNELIEVEKGKVPKKRRGIDIPFGESSAARNTFLGALAAAAIFLLFIGFGVQQYRQATIEDRLAKEKSDREAKFADAQTNLNAIYAGAEGATGVRAQVAKKQFGAARNAFETLSSELKAKNYVLVDAEGNTIQNSNGVDQDAFLVGDYPQKLESLKGEVERARESRDAAVKKRKEEISAARQALDLQLTAFAQELAAEKQRVVSFNDAAQQARADLFQRLREISGLRIVDPQEIRAEPKVEARKALALVFDFEQDPNKSYGDAGQGAYCREQRKAIVEALTRQGDALLAEVGAGLKDTRLLDRWRYYGRAVQLYEGVLRQFPASLEVDAKRDWKVSLDTGNVAAQRSEEIKDQEPRSLLYAAELNLAEALIEAKRKKVEYLPYGRMIKAYLNLPESPRKREVLDVLEAGRSESVTNLRQTIFDRAEALIEPDEKGARDNFKSALKFVADERRTLEELVGGGDPAAREEAERKLDEARGQIERRIFERYRELRREIEDLAWRQRRFPEADARCDALTAQAEFDVALPALIGDERTIQDHFQDLRAKFELNLTLLRGKGYVGFPAGSYSMGDAGSGYPSEVPVHSVEVRALVVDKTEVTVRDYKSFLRTTDSLENGLLPAWACRPHLPVKGICHPQEQSYQHPEFGHAHPSLVEFEYDASGQPRLDEQGKPLVRFRTGVSDDKPIVNVTWYDAYAFARWAGKRLPSEAEWEAIASAEIKGGAPTGSKHLFPWGERFDRSVVASARNHDEWFPEDLPVTGSKPEGATPLGILDLAGSVDEWTASYYDVYPGGDRSVDGSFGNLHRSIRGGAFSDYRPVAFRTTRRNRALPGERRVNLGFRCVREATADD